MEKKAALIFLVIFAMMIFTYFKVGTKDVSKEDKDIEISEKSTSVNERLIGNINTIEVYSTDYKYNTSINEYVYAKQELSINQEQLKKDISSLNLNNKTTDVVYGKYKMIIDDKTIFFDLDSDSALYLEEDITFVFPRSIKNKYFSTNDNCSCCENIDKCKINLCSCENNLN